MSDSDQIGGGFNKNISQHFSLYAKQLAPCWNIEQHESHPHSVFHSYSYCHYATFLVRCSFYAFK
jgi:hypothetical protein